MMIINSSLMPVNNYKINYITLTLPDAISIDVTKELLSLNIIEIIDGLTKGSISLQNRSNITGLMKTFTGQEIISVSFASGTTNAKDNDGVSTYRKDYTKHFRCVTTNYQNNAQADNPISTLTFDLINVLESLNSCNRFSKHYIDTSPSAIITDMMQHFIVNKQEVFNVEDTVSIGDITINLDSPLNIIEKLKAVSISSDTESQSSDFRFFENRDGLHYVTTGALKKVAPTYSFAIKSHLKANDAGSSSTLNIHSINGFWLTNIGESYHEGVFGANTTTTSLIDKSFNFYRQNREDLDAQVQQLNKKTTLYATESVSGASMDTYNRNLLSSADTIYSKMNNDRGFPHVGSAILERSKNNTKRITIKSAGFTDLTAGDVVEVAVPDIDNGNSSNSKLNTNMTGKWIVAAISYSLNLTHFESDYTLISDSNI